MIGTEKQIAWAEKIRDERTPILNCLKKALEIDIEEVGDRNIDVGVQGLYLNGIKISEREKTKGAYYLNGLSVKTEIAKCIIKIIEKLLITENSSIWIKCRDLNERSLELLARKMMGKKLLGGEEIIISEYMELITD